MVSWCLILFCIANKHKARDLIIQIYSVGSLQWAVCSYLYRKPQTINRKLPTTKTTTPVWYRPRAGRRRLHSSPNWFLK